MQDSAELFVKSLWLSPRTVEALAMPEQVVMSL